DTNGVVGLTWSLGFAPAIAAGSSSQLVAKDGEVTWSLVASNVVAAGVGVTNALPPPTVQWFFNDLELANNSRLALSTVPYTNTLPFAASNRFTLRPAQLSDAGS